MKRFQLVNFYAVVFILAACSPQVDQLGYVKAADWKDRITVGSTTRDEVLEAFGSPSAQSTFGEETWYYVSIRQETTAFLRPENTEQDIVRVQFNDRGVVSDIAAYDQESAKRFDLVDRTTPTEGHSMGVVEQLVGNIGRFNRTGDDKSIAPGGRSR